LFTTIVPGSGDVQGHGVLVALVLEELDEEVDGGAEEDLDEDVGEEVDDVVEPDCQSPPSSYPTTP